MANERKEEEVKKDVKAEALKEANDKKFYRNGKRLKFFEVELKTAGFFFGVCFPAGSVIWLRDIEENRINAQQFELKRTIGYCDERWNDYIDYMTDMKDALASSNRTKKIILLNGK